LTGTNMGFDLLRNDIPNHSRLGYMAYLIGKATVNNENNIKLKLGNAAIKALCIIQESIGSDNLIISHNRIIVQLLERFPFQNIVQEKTFIRYLVAGAFCQIGVNQEEFIRNILQNSIDNLKIIEEKVPNTVRTVFRNSSDIVNSINNNIDITQNIYNQKASLFLIGDLRSSDKNGNYYEPFQEFRDFFIELYKKELDINNSEHFSNLLNKNKDENYDIFEKLQPILHDSLNYRKVMKTLQEGCLEAIKILGWSTPVSISENTKNIIYYGAPGTGKSNKVKELVQGREERTERVTFHPEYDYSSFVGGYKPTMEGKDIRYEFVPQAFTKIYCDAWNSLSLGENIDFYLVIEEINRGNCAEIFGDIFQLLDRNSEYDISPSKELKEFLLDEKKGLYDKEFGLKGDKLKLPPNLNILATMNTSDQSLFPMDSAFKRRWDWEYIPINYEFSENNQSSKYKVKITDKLSFSWLSFIKSVNDYVKHNDNLGMDKCIGNYFIKPVDEFIELETFINKAIFYLWNDVFKDEAEEQSIFKNKVTYEDFFPINPNGI